MLMGGLLLLKHIFRGLLFSWPLYLLSMTGLTLPGEYSWLFILLLIPAVLVSTSILLLGLSEAYQAQVTGRLLKIRDWKRIVLGNDP